ncbi:uncharacterized protein IUM83_12768 [Phytophthora cinnamomi]|uniref:uncharacterized protein n=1 Tax=Phytophthora cinnamomi TaxID=4785 RepID=UPI0035595D3A|nr:hypothetical protein IUM83_12768 [Phytophthora cinnamomi]
MAATGKCNGGTCETFLSDKERKSSTLIDSNAVVLTSGGNEETAAYLTAEVTKKESKAGCWVKIAEHLAHVLNKKLSSGRLRKHINKLEKVYKKEADADRTRSG